MSWTLDHQPLNREGHTAFRPWRVLRGGRLFRAYTTHAIAIAAIDLLQAEEAYSRHAVYKRMGTHGSKSRHR